MRWFLLALALLLAPGGVAADTVVRSPITVGPGLTAEGSRVSTYTPQVCDGFSANDGTIASVATDAQAKTFTSALANFTAADVGKIISIADAGPTLFIRDATPVTFAITSLSWANVAGGRITVVGTVPLPVTGIGSPLVISGATNTGTGLNAAINRDFLVDTFVDNQNFTLAAPAAVGVYGTLGGSPVAVGGGLSHTVNEQLTLVGGTGTAGKLRVMRAPSGVITHASGLAHSLGKYTAAPSNPVTAGDATFTLNWNGDNLVTTIAAVVNPTTVTLATAASRTVSGARWGYGSDYSAQISAGLASSSAAQLPDGKCGIASSITVPPRGSLKGLGSGSNQDAHTMLLWLGPVDGTVFDEDTGIAIPNMEISFLGVDGLCAASTGLKLMGVQQSRVDAVSVFNVKDSAFYLDASTNSPADDNFFNYYNHWTASLIANNCAKNAHAFNFPRTNGLNDVNGNIFMFPNAKTRNGDGFHIGEGFLNAFHMYQHYLGDDAADFGFGIWFGAASGADLETVSARSNVFYHMISKGDLYAQAGNVRNSERNWILPLEVGSEPTFQVIKETGARLFCINTRGSSDYCQPHAHKNSFSAGPFSTTSTAVRKVLTVTANPYTPVYSGRNVMRTGGQANVDAIGRGIQLSLWYGTGTAPSAGDDVPAGAVRCGEFAGFEDAHSTTFGASFAIACNLNDLTRDTDYWMAIAGQGSGGAGNFSVKNIVLQAYETP